MIKRLLIANRGEIACRIIRAAHAMGIETVAVYSDADAGAQHVKQAGRTFAIGPAPAAQSYLNMDAILEAAKATDADAVHPGYGFLSENAAFAKAVADAGLTFVGPATDVIALMGDKRTARGIAEKAGVPVVPGYDGDDGDDALLLEKARLIGVPLMIKATAGGGGRGLRRVDNLNTFMDDLQSARREAGSAFGNSGILLEKLITSARHVEVQVLADSQGNTVHLYERDCSSQRRHQKVIEEAPCATISDETRAGLAAAAVSLAKVVGYTGAGTVEFLVDNEGAFYFLEMNTRLQVEHPVTEMVTGIDLVTAQLRIASGEVLGFTQDDIRLKGHAIEARLYAEDPAHAFMPQTGALGVFDIPVGEGTRLDTGVTAGDSVSPFYDPMLAKLVAYGKTRDEARLRLVTMLRDSRIAGVATNKSWLKWLLHGDIFSSGAMRTQTLDQAPTFLPVPALNQAMGIAIVMQAEALKACPLPALAGWRTLSGSYDRRVLEVDGERITLKVWQTRREGGWDITVEADGQERTVHFDGTHYYLESEKARGAYCRNGDRHFADLGRWHFTSTDITHAPAEKATTGTSGILTAPMDGQIVAVPVEDGTSVKAGDLVCVIEAMKMEHHIKADMDGMVTNLTAKVGAQVKGRAPLAMIEPGENA